MKKYQSILVLLFTFLLILLPACGSREDTNTTRTVRDFFIIEETTKELATPDVNRDWRCLGMQFLDGEVLQIWGQSVKNEQLRAFLDVYLYHEDGTVEFLYGGINSKYRSGWYRDDEGSCFVLLGDTLIKLDASGQEVYSRTYENRSLKNLYRDKNGKWMLLAEVENRTLLVSELNRETGELTDKGTFELEDGVQHISGQEDGVYLLNTQGAWKLNWEEGTKESVLSFTEHYYTFEIFPTNFVVTEGAAINLLQAGKVISLARVNMAETRQVVLLTGCQQLPEIEECIAKFNKENDTYYVAWEKLQEKQSVNDYKEKIAVEIGTGGGPDLMFVGASVTPGNIWDFKEKGVFERLNPYMEQSGIKEEDYFPVAFNGLRDGEDIYGISVLTQFGGQWVSAELLGSTETPTMEELLDALIAYEKPAVLFPKANSDTLVSLFLKGSDTVAGAVDWENGTCDFSGELFTKILKVAKRYGDDRTMTMDSLGGSLTRQGLYNYTLREDQISQGKVPVWNYFDDGCVPGYVIMYTLVVNSNGLCKEGAWAFLEYLLTGDLQSMRDYSRYPVSRKGFEELIAHELEEGSLVLGKPIPGTAYGNVIAKAGTDDEFYTPIVAAMHAEEYKARYDLTEEKVEEIRQLLEDSRTFPVHTQPIMSIILGESGAYFAGQKELEEVCRIIENRVQLYLDEHN